VGVAVTLTVIATAGLLLLTLGLWSRIRFARQPDSFRCRLGPPHPRRRKRARWRLGRTRAVWVDTVLLVRSGFLGPGVRPIAVRVPRDTVAQPLRPGEVRGLGRRPVSLRLTSQDGARVEVAVAEESSSLLVGPFLTADPGLPRAPRDPRAPHDRSA
jgi:hypothetical protein